jgi:hypothetical protein
MLSGRWYVPRITQNRNAYKDFIRETEITGHLEDVVVVVVVIAVVVVVGRILSLEGVTTDGVLDWIIGFTDHLQDETTNNHNAIADFNTLQLTRHQVFSSL